MQTTLLAIREVIGEHTGDNMAAVALKVIKEYKIGKKIVYFMLDNASSNDVCIDLILKRLYPRMSEKKRSQRRLRCLGHVINLAAQIFILGKDAEADLRDLEFYQLQGDFKSITEAWRKKGVLGKIHNIVKYIRMTPQRRQEFAACVVDDRELEVFNHLDVSTIDTYDISLNCLE